MMHGAPHSHAPPELFQLVALEGWIQEPGHVHRVAREAVVGDGFQRAGEGPPLLGEAVVDLPKAAVTKEAAEGIQELPTLRPEEVHPEPGAAPKVQIVAPVNGEADGARMVLRGLHADAEEPALVPGVAPQDLHGALRRGEVLHSCCWRRRPCGPRSRRARPRKRGDHLRAEPLEHVCHILALEEGLGSLQPSPIALRCLEVAPGRSIEVRHVHQLHELAYLQSQLFVIQQAPRELRPHPRDAQAAHASGFEDTGQVPMPAQQLRRLLHADARHARQVVAGVARERQEVAHLARPHAPARFHRVVVHVVVEVLQVGVDMDLSAGQLHKVLVGRNDADAAVLGSLRCISRNEVICLVAVHRLPRHAHRLACVPCLGELAHEIAGAGAVALVRGVGLLPL
mmetsp:Transcript_116122/g.339534  ORF Transcript_116122/g.339534 Transcript_116122/m.339534 type:complete len:398 (-) Transcript_116122:446-1639(-)